MTADTAPQFAGLGFAVGSVRGTRTFRVTIDGFLRGVVFPTIWAPGVNQAACLRRSYSACGYTPDAGGVHKHSWRCWIGEPCGKRIPGEGCKCGFYGYYDGSNDYATVNSIGAIVEGFGKVSIGQRGFRAEKARILALSIPAPKPLPVRSDVGAGLLAGVPMTVHPPILSAPSTDPVRPAWLTQEIAGKVIGRYQVPTYSDLAAMLIDFPPDPPRVKEV